MRTNGSEGQPDSTSEDSADSEVRSASRRRRRIGLWGTISRVVAGAGCLALGLAVPQGNPWFDLPGAGSRTWGAAVGLLIIPALLTLVMVLRGRSAVPLRLGHRSALLVTGVVVLLAQVFPVAVLVSIGSTLLLLAARGEDGCEILAVPNLVLHRRDHLACLPFTPIDAWERRRR